MKWLVTFALISASFAEIADYGYIPEGNNTLLYDPNEDPIIQLDDIRFNDTIFASKNAFMVEFYADWCGYCRRFSSVYKKFAIDVRSWGNIVKIAAINCADRVNWQTCSANRINLFPTLKYFALNKASDNPSKNGLTMIANHSVGKLRYHLINFILADYFANYYNNWPNFQYLVEMNTYNDLWEQFSESTKFFAILFEKSKDSHLGAELMLDLYSQKALTIRRALNNHTLIKNLEIVDFPTLIIFRLNQLRPVYFSKQSLNTTIFKMKSSKELFLREIRIFTEIDKSDLFLPILSSNRKMTTPTTFDKFTFNLSCDENPDRCKKLFFVSETDMLKAVRFALTREITKSGIDLRSEILTALINFVELLSKHFSNGEPENNRSSINETTHQSNSWRARQIFTQLLAWLKSKNGSISVDEWMQIFRQLESQNGRPFPVGAKWEHCRGSTPKFRGYSCGLWTVFHAITVQAYLNDGKLSNFSPYSVLMPIRGWVDRFFSCAHCRNHFLKMTNETFPMETEIRKPQDVFLYLWKAHNIVNARLEEDKQTEDPNFPKLQFPAPFLCADCRIPSSNMEDEQFDEEKVAEFLLTYYTDIKY